MEPVAHLATLSASMPLAEGNGIGTLGWIIYLALIVLVVAGFWKMFEKAGKPGWAAIVPIYNMIVMLEIAGRPIWWIILLIIPIVSIVVVIIVMIDIAKSFGKGAGFAIGLVFLPFIFGPLLGFGDATYKGPAAAS
jgi:hypothetical protein